MTLYNREGEVFTGEPEIIDGKPCYMVPVPCNRCCVVDGQRIWLMGIENGRPFSRTGFDCWTCGNSGVRKWAKERLYTAEGLARVTKSAATREAKRAAKAAAEAQAAEQARAAKEGAFYADNAEFLAKLNSLDGEFWEGFRSSFLQRMAAPTARQIELVEGEVAKRLQNASSGFLGAPGDKVELTIKVERVIRLDSQWGTNWITIARTPGGDVVTYKGQINLGDQGDTATIKATVKDHTVYNGVKQTVIQRPKIVD